MTDLLFVSSPVARQRPFLISLIPLLDSYPRDLVPPTGDASGGAEEGNRGERRGSSRRLEK